MSMSYKVPLRDVVYLKSRWCRKLKKRNTGVPTSCIYEPTRTVSCTTVYNYPPGDNVWGSKLVITRCVIL